MKKILAFVLALGMLCTGALSVALAAEETLYERIYTLFEEGDETFGLGLGIGMDDGEEPAGKVTVELNREQGVIVLRHEQDYAIWEFMDMDDPDCMNVFAQTLLVLCARWEILTDGMTDDLSVIFRGGENKLHTTIESADGAKAFLNSVYEKIIE